jgi:hypothetical protein
LLPRTDPLASHIFVSRRHYRNINDTKSGKRREMTARLSFNTACELGFRGSLDEGGASWEQLQGAEPSQHSQFFEIALVLVRLDQVASGIVNANDRVM